MLSSKKGIVYTMLGILALFVFAGMPGQTKAVGISRPSCPFRITVADGLNELCRKTNIINHSPTGVSFRRDNTMVVGREMTARRATFDLTGAVERRITLRLNEKAIIHPVAGTATLEATYRGLAGGNNFKIEFNTVPIAVIESGSLTVNSDSFFLDTQVVPGATEAVLFRGILTAGSPEDVLLNQLIFTPEEGMYWDANLHNFSLLINGEQYGATVQSFGNQIIFSNIDFTANKNNNYVFAVKTDVDSLASAGFVDAQMIGTNALGVSSGNDIVVKNAAGLAIDLNNPLTTEYDVFIMPVSKLSISIDASTPSSSLALAGTEASLAVFRFNAASSAEDVEIDHISLTQLVNDTRYASYLDYDAIWFEDDAGMEIPGTRMVPTSTKPFIDFNAGAFRVDSSDTDGVTLNLKAKLAEISPGFDGVSGHRLGYKINAVSDVSATGVSSGNPGSIMFDSALPTANLHYVYKAVPSIHKVSLPSNRLANGTNDLARFGVSAIGQDVSIHQLSFAIVTNVPNVSNLYLYDITGGSETPVNDTPGSIVSGEWSTNGSDWLTNFPNGEMTVSLNSTRVYALRGNLSGVSAGSYIQIKLLGDAAAPNCGDASMCSAAAVSADANNNFIWSDKNASAHSLNTPDWTNGYLAKTLPVAEALYY